MLRIKMMVKKKSEIIPAVFLILVSIILSGCWASTETEVAKTDNINQSRTASDNSNMAANNNVSGTSVNTPTSIVNNTSAPIPNNSTSAPTANNNTSMPNAGKDKKPSPPVKEPTPHIGSGGGDMFLFTQARGALSSDPELINAVIIEIKEGNATLTGSVSSQAQKTKAGQLVQNVQGIKSVKNSLRVSS